MIVVIVLTVVVIVCIFVFIIVTTQLRSNVWLADAHALVNGDHTGHGEGAVAMLSPATPSWSSPGSTCWVSQPCAIFSLIARLTCVCVQNDVKSHCKHTCDFVIKQSWVPCECTAGPTHPSVVHRAHAPAEYDQCLCSDVPKCIALQCNACSAGISSLQDHPLHSLVPTFNPRRNCNDNVLLILVWPAQPAIDATLVSLY